MSIPSTLTFDVSIPTEDDYLGRECNNPECKKYFKVHIDSLREDMYCPYCGELFKKDELWSTDQLEYAKKVAQEETMELLQREFNKMMKKTISASKYVSYKPGSPYHKKTIVQPQSKEVDSELKCPSCKSSFQVYGIFGYCPVCRSENLLLYDANWEIIKQEIANSKNKERAIRHAYADLVSTFENFCRKKGKKYSLEKGRFQNLTHTRKQFKDKANINIFEGLLKEEIRDIKRVFEKRHITEHNNGVISDRYIKQIPEDIKLLGKKANLSVEELELASKILKTILDNLV